MPKLIARAILAVLLLVGVLFGVAIYRIERDAPPDATKPSAASGCSVDLPQARLNGVSQPDNGQDDAAFIEQHYGTPDVDDSTAYDNPRPPIVTRWFEYKREGVKVMFSPNAEFGDAPPYRSWKVFAYMSIPTQQTLTEGSAAALLADRCH